MSKTWLFTLLLVVTSGVAVADTTCAEILQPTAVLREAVMRLTSHVEGHLIGPEKLENIIVSETPINPFASDFAPKILRAKESFEQLTQRLTFDEWTKIREFARNLLKGKEVEAKAKDANKSATAQVWAVLENPEIFDLNQVVRKDKVSSYVICDTAGGFPFVLVRTKLNGPPTILEGYDPETGRLIFSWEVPKNLEPSNASGTFIGNRSDDGKNIIYSMRHDGLNELNAVIEVSDDGKVTKARRSRIHTSQEFLFTSEFQKYLLRTQGVNWEVNPKLHKMGNAHVATIGGFRIVNNLGRKVLLIAGIFKEYGPPQDSYAFYVAYDIATNREIFFDIPVHTRGTVTLRGQFTQEASGNIYWVDIGKIRSSPYFDGKLMKTQILGPLLGVAP